MDEPRQTYRDVGEESLHFRRQQLTRYTHAYSITFTMPMARAANTPTFLETQMQVMEDADFHITHITGCAVSPVDSNGVRVVDRSSAKSLFFPAAGDANRSDRGMSFKIIDPKSNARLSSGQQTPDQIQRAAQAVAVDHSYLNFGDVFGPGYDYQFGAPVPFKYFLDRGARFKVLFQCVDGKASALLYQRISMCFIGNRYES